VPDLVAPPPELPPELVFDVAAQGGAVVAAEFTLGRKTTGAPLGPPDPAALDVQRGTMIVWVEEAPGSTRMLLMPGRAVVTVPPPPAEPIPLEPPPPGAVRAPPAELAPPEAEPEPAVVSPPELLVVAVAAPDPPPPPAAVRVVGVPISLNPAPGAST
jgi:hypothetical protein